MDDRRSRTRTTRSRRARPYAAAKAAGELLVRSYVVTHGLDAVVTRGSNTYGPYQHPEKLIPLFVTNAIDDQPLPLYGDGLQRRDWLYVADHAGGDRHGPAPRRRRRDLQPPGRRARCRTATSSRLLLERLGKPWSLVRHVEDRPGHDRRYAMDGSKLAALGWRPRPPSTTGLAATVDWFVANEALVAGGALRRLGRLLRAPVRGAPRADLGDGEA